MSISDKIAILSVALAIVVPLFIYLWNRYSKRPALIIQLGYGGGGSSPLGVSRNNKAIREDGYIDGNNATRLFRVEWIIDVIIRNNSDHTAYYPKIHLITPSFSHLEPLDELKPLQAAGEARLKGEFVRVEEVGPNDTRRDGGGIPTELSNMELLLEYKNGSGVTFYTLYQHLSKTNQHRWRKPKRFKG